MKGEGGLARGPGNGRLIKVSSAALKRMASSLLGAPMASSSSLSHGWRDLLLYDVIPANCSHVSNESFALKDYGDALGDAYYAMRALLPPLLCDVCRSEEPGPDAFCVRYNYVAVGTCYSEQATPGPQVARKISGWGFRTPAASEITTASKSSARREASSTSSAVGT